MVAGAPGTLLSLRGIVPRYYLATQIDATRRHGHSSGHAINHRNALVSPITSISTSQTHKTKW
eukprot:2722766-Rhodomonas_salina.1